MTSRNLFFNLLKEDFRRRLWTFILSSLVFFGTFVVAFTMGLQNWVGRYNRNYYDHSLMTLAEKVSGELCSDFYGFYPWFVFVAIVGAIICGMSGFSYLHSRKQMDFYHSLPVKREMIFAVRLVNGILIYAVPYLVGLLYSYVLCIFYGVMTSDIFFCGAFFFVLHLMGYIIMYLVTILAMMLTGKMVIAFFGTCVLNLYAPAIYALVMVLRETFFVTSYNGSVDIEDALLITKWLSPSSFYFSLVYALEEGNGTFWTAFLAFLLLATVLVVLVLWLYKKRASEKADTAMSFKVTEPVIRVMLSIPIGVLAGLLFFALQYDNNGASIFWLIFGGLLGGFLAHGIIEALYNGDIKKCLSHKVQMLVSMVIAAVVPLVFLYDVFGYDSYLPEKDEIANMAVVSYDMRFGGSYYDEDGWISPNEYALENMEVTQIDAMYELAELLTKDAGENRTARFFGYSGNYYATRISSYVTEADMYYANGTGKVHNTDFIIRYTLKDGSEVIRRYEYNYYAVLDLLERIYNNDEFKTAVHPVFSLLKTNWKTEFIECFSPASGTSVKLEKNCGRIIETYAEELLSLSFEDLKNTAAIGELVVHFVVDAENEYTDNTTFLVYPGMTRTIALIKEQGYNMRNVQESPHTDSITVYYGGTITDLRYQLGMEEEEIYYINMNENSASWEMYEKYGVLAYQYPTEEKYQDISVTFSDPAEIAEIKKALIYSNYVSEFGPFPERVTYLTAEVFFEVGGGETLENGLIGWTERFRFEEGKVPQFVIDRIFEELGAGVN